jgi:hypothetical protein
MLGAVDSSTKGESGMEERGLNKLVRDAIYNLIAGKESEPMPARYEVEIDGIVYDIMANGRAKACGKAACEHTGYVGQPVVEFLRYVSSGVVYNVETPEGTYEATVKQ